MTWLCKENNIKKESNVCAITLHTNTHESQRYYSKQHYFGAVSHMAQVQIHQFLPTRESTQCNISIINNWV